MVRDEGGKVGKGSSGMAVEGVWVSLLGGQWAAGGGLEVGEREDQICF